jgi:AAA+ ATPase superfamily predicted ATPase
MTPTLNPYIYTQPLTDRKYFYGRKTEIVRIYSRIASDRPQSVSIVGESRIGKTSLLNWLCHSDSRLEYLSDPARYLYLLLSLKKHLPAHPGAFFTLISDTLAYTDQAEMAPSAEGFRRLVECLVEEQRKLVLFCDDFEVVTQNPAFPLDFFSFMRSIANNYDVAYVTTSSSQLQKLCSSKALRESPFFNIFTTVNLRSLTEEEAEQLIREPAIEAGAPFMEETEEELLRVAGFHPYLLQLTAGLAFEAQVNGKLKMEEITEKAFREARSFFITLWKKKFTETQRQVFRIIHEGKTVKNRNRYAAEEMERRGHLKRIDNDYVITSLLLERFVKEYGGGGFWKRLFG